VIHRRAYVVHTPSALSVRGLHLVTGQWSESSPHTTSRPILVRSLKLWTSLQVLAPSLRLSDSDVYARCIAEIIRTIGVYDEIQKLSDSN